MFLKQFIKEPFLQVQCEHILHELYLRTNQHNRLCIFTDGSAQNTMSTDSKCSSALIVTVVPQDDADQYVADLSKREHIKNKQRRKKCKEGFILNPYDYPHWKISARVDGNNTSTLGELRALTLAMILTPPDRKCHVFIDSQSAIDIAKSVETIQDPSSYLKWKYCIEKGIMYQVKMNLQTFGGCIHIHKLRGHSQETGNNIADKEADEQGN